jgi:DNA-binding Lrp family transcriptional regulator
MELDRIDFAIVEALSNDARMSNKDLAAKVGLAPSSCLGRVRALGRAGVLLGYHAQVDPASLGIGMQAMVSIRFSRTTRDIFRSLQAHLLDQPEVVSVFHVSGPTDLQVHVVVRDIDHLQHFIVERVATRPEVGHCETAVVFEARKKGRLPCLVPPKS